MFTKILGTGGYLPQTVRTNADLERMVDTSDAWIMERTGISERRIANSFETCATMGFAAAQKALESASLKAEDIDLIICATTTGEKAFPSTAVEIAGMLGISGVPAFDLQAACAGFSYGYCLAHSMILSGQAKNVLIIGSDMMSRACAPDDRTTIILFGDGAGAVILGASDNDVFKHAVVALAKLVSKTLELGGLKPEDLDFLVPHQANLRIITATAKKLRLDMSQVIVTLDKQGNTSSASVPLALDEGIRSGRIKRGQVLLLESFGGGFTWGSALIRY